MADRRVVCGGSSATGGGSGGDLISDAVLLQNKRVPGSAQPLDSPFTFGSSPSFLGSRSMVSFKDAKATNKSFYCSFDQEDNLDGDLDGYFLQPEKKRRLTAGQVQFLEKSFEVENKLEPERKVQLAKDLGLRPRQVAIWFQNRRARGKSKQLEKDYEGLEASYKGLKDDYDNLLNEKEKLKSEVSQLMDKLLLKQKEMGNSELPASGMLSRGKIQEPVPDLLSEVEVSQISFLTRTPDDVSSTKSNLLDSDSPHSTDGNHSYPLEPGYSSHVFEADHSNLSQDEEDNLSKSLLPLALTPYVFPNVEDARYPDLLANSCYFGLQDEDQTFGFWVQ